MRGMQEKLLDLIERRLVSTSCTTSGGSDGLEVVKSTGNAYNIGKLYAQRGVETYATIEYDFQSGYAGLKLQLADAGLDLPIDFRELAPLQNTLKSGLGKQTVQWHVLHYHDSQGIEAMLFALGAVGGAVRNKLREDEVA